MIDLMHVIIGLDRILYSVFPSVVHTAAREPLLLEAYILLV